MALQDEIDDVFNDVGFTGILLQLDGTTPATRGERFNLTISPELDLRRVVSGLRHAAEELENNPPGFTALVHSS